jgi:hypothetical protein
MTAKERIRGYTVVMNNWYGRYKYNVITNEILAVDYQEKVMMYYLWFLRGIWKKQYLMLKIT